MSYRLVGLARETISNDTVFDSTRSVTCGVTDSSVTRRDLTVSVYMPGLSNRNHSFSSSVTVNGFSPSTPIPRLPPPM